MWPFDIKKKKQEAEKRKAEVARLANDRNIRIHMQNGLREKARREAYESPVVSLTDPTNIASPLSPLNPINQMIWNSTPSASYDCSPSHHSSYDSGSSYSSSSSDCSSSSSDSSSSSCGSCD